MQPEVHYARSQDGISIAFWKMGEGDVPLVMGPPLGWSHIALECQIPELFAWYERLATTRQLVRYDERGSGLSQRNVEDMSEEAQAGDLEAVIERIGCKQVDLFGFTGAAPPFMRTAVLRADTVRRIVFWNPFLRGADHLVRPRVLAIQSLIDQDWDLFTETYASTIVGWGQQEAHAWAQFIRASVNPEDTQRMFAAVSQYDATSWLPRIEAPTLVISPRRPERDREPSRDIAAGIQNARLLEVVEPILPFRDERALRSIEDFLGEDGSPARPNLPSGTAVILFVDIADSTALTERMGDAAFREKARGLDDALRSAVHDSGGTVIDAKTLGDGILATFPAASHAIAAALACQAAGDVDALPLHLGLHAGDVIRESDNVFGGAVNIAARISSLSAPGEVLVSDIVRGLARTSAGVTFEDRGEHALKGVSDVQRVYAVTPNA